ncbi:MAG TPA: signal peptidase I [Candidatus Bipolaricaulota bacterium]|nr:signal peptidase I [Candidatus Bipolaricaulota bacterium]
MSGDPFITNKSKGKIIFEFIWDLAKVACISLAIIIPVRYFLIQPFYVKGASMEPNLHDHEYLIINEIGYRLDEPQRGDVVVFKYPQDQTQFFIKRVIGLSGEIVELKDGVVYLYSKDENGEDKRYVLNETFYLDPQIKTWGDRTFQIGENEFFVMGDNRSQSLDSRSFGPVDKDLIVGKVWLRGWPFDKFQLFSQIDYGF